MRRHLQAFLLSLGGLLAVAGSGLMMFVGGAQLFLELAELRIWNKL
jgi:hypothetical protein